MCPGICSVLTKEYQDVLRWISPVVEQHKKTLVPGVPQLNMCDVAVMVRFKFKISWSSKCFFNEVCIQGTKIVGPVRFHGRFDWTLAGRPHPEDFVPVLLQQISAFAFVYHRHTAVLASLT